MTLLCLVAASTAAAHRPGEHPPGTLAAPLVHWRGYLIETTNEIRAEKCRPSKRPTYAAWELPRSEAYRRHAVTAWLGYRLAALRASSACNPTSPPGTVLLGQSMAAAYGWTGSQWTCLYLLWGPYESSWRVYADNPRSSAYGIPQALPGSKMGTGWQHSARVQIRWGLGYISGRYGTPCAALSFRRSAGYY